MGSTDQMRKNGLSWILKLFSRPLKVRGATGPPGSMASVAMPWDHITGKCENGPPLGASFRRRLAAWLHRMAHTLLAKGLVTPSTKPDAVCRGRLSADPIQAEHLEKTSGLSRLDMCACHRTALQKWMSQ